VLDQQKAIEIKIQLLKQMIFLKARVVVSDETIAKETADDFADIDAW
jgi:hypothetical protein